MANLSEFLAKSYVIRDATEEGENTADRVGGCFVNAGDVFTTLLSVKSSNGRITTFEDNAIVCEGNKVTFGTNWDMFHGNGYYAAGGNVAVPQVVTVGAASGVVYLDITDNLLKWTSAVSLLGEKAIIVAHTKDDAVVEVFANRYIKDGKVTGSGGTGGTDMQTVWTELAADGTQQINVSHLRNALASCTWWGAQMTGNAVTGSLSDVANITMSGKITIGGFVIEYDATNNALKFGGSIYATGGVTAMGYQSGGGGDVQLNEPLSSINNAGLGTPSQTGVALVWNGSTWGYQVVGGGGGTGSVTSVGLSVPTGLRVNNNTGATITTTGVFALTFADGYAIPLTADVAKGVSAYGWGDHSQAGYATQSWVNNQSFATQTWVNNKGYATEAWVEGKGYTTNAGTVTSVALSVPTGFYVSGSPVTSSGTLSLRFASGYSLPTTTKQSQWDTAYGWGNHASAGYITQTAADGRYVTLATSQTITADKTFADAVGFNNNIFLSKNGSQQFINFSNGYTGAIGQSANGDLYIYSGEAVNWYTSINSHVGLYHAASGNIGVNTTNPQYNCDVTGVIRATDSIIVGDGKIAWDATNNALYVQKKDGSVCHFYSLGGVSALGVGTGSGASINTLKVTTLNATNVNASSEIVTANIKPTGTGIIDLWTSDNSYYWEFNYQDTYAGTLYYALDCYNVGLYGENSNADNTWRITPEGFAEFSTVKCGVAQLLSNYVYINALVRLRANGATVYLETRTSTSASWEIKETWN